MPVSPLILQDLSLLRGLPRETLDRLGQLMSVREMARREVLFRKGETTHALYFLLEGRMQAIDFTIDGREVGMYFVDAGDYFGELPVIDDGPQNEFMVAVAKSRIASLPAVEAKHLVLETSTLAGQMMVRFAQRLRNAGAQRTLLALPNPAQRVCAQLLQLSVTAGRTGKLTISHAPTHQEIAIMINSSRETVTRVFQVLQARGVLKRDGTALDIDNPDYLQAVAMGKAEPPKAG